MSVGAEIRVAELVEALPSFLALCGTLKKQPFDKLRDTDSLGVSDE
jgi:hypothetical protein